MSIDRAFSIPDVWKVRVYRGLLRGVVRCDRDDGPQQHRFIDAYRLEQTPAHEPHIEFANLIPQNDTDSIRLAVDFTRRFGPLVWGNRVRLRSRPLEPKEQLRGVSGPRSRRRVVDQRDWTMPLSEFWKEQRRYRRIFNLAVAVSAQRDQLPTVLLEALSEMMELHECFSQHAERSDDPSVRDKSPAHRVEAWLTSEFRKTTLASPRHPDQWWFSGPGFIAAEVGRVVGGLIDSAVVPTRITYQPREGFQSVQACKDLRGLLYWRLAQGLTQGKYDFCGHCNRIYFRGRLDKRTCSQLCAQRWSKREHARQRRARAAIVRASQARRPGR